MPRQKSIQHVYRTLGFVFMFALLMVTLSIFSGGVDNAYAAPPAQETPFIQVSPDALQAGYYEETHPDFVYNDRWRFKQKSQASGGGLVKARSGATLSFSFEGQVLVIYRRTRPDDGPMEVCIDDVCELVENHSTAILWQAPVSFGPLGQGVHNVTISRVGRAFFLDAFAVQNLGPPLPEGGMYQETYQDLLYVGEWVFKSKARASDGGIVKPRNEDSALYFRFRGDELTIYRTVGPGFGSMEVCVGRTCYVIDNEHSERLWQQPVTLSGFGDGNHRAKISRVGGARLLLDALMTVGYTPPPEFTPTNPPPPTATETLPPTATDPATATDTATWTPTFTPTSTHTATFTPTATDTLPPTSTDDPTATDTATWTPTFTPTSTNTPTFTPTATDTVPPTATHTATFTPTFTPTATQQALDQISLYDSYHLIFWSQDVPANPFDTYLLRVRVTDPAGNTFDIDGYYDGDGSGGQNGNVWRAHITPDRLGVWSWQTVPADNGIMDPGLANHSGQFEAVPGSETGAVVRDGQYFRFQNGDPVFLVGNFLDFTNGLPSTHVYPSHEVQNWQRDQVIDRQMTFHAVNKINVYFANRGDYDSLSVIPWLGDENNPDYARMNLAHWRNFDEYLDRFELNNLVAELWFFADDSNFGSVSDSDRFRLLRYAMARTSHRSSTMFVIALEWQEGFSWGQINDMGNYLDAHNPWDRLLSAHLLPETGWDFGGQSWPGFIASQSGNSSQPHEVNSYTINFHNNESLPHLGEEFGILDGDSDARLRGNLWANFTGGAAGSGTGSDLRAFGRFLEQSGVPYYAMDPANHLVEDGGNSRFVLAQNGHHYVVYSRTGAFTLTVSGSNLTGYWFNPRDPNASLGNGFSVPAGTMVFTPPFDQGNDWVLWITDGSG